MGYRRPMSSKLKVRKLRKASLTPRAKIKRKAVRQMKSKIKAVKRSLV